MSICTFCGQACQGACRIVDVVKNKAISEYCLCDSCGLAYVNSLLKKPAAKSKGKQHVPIKVINSAASLLAILVKPEVAPPLKKNVFPPCPKCGHTISDIQSTGKLGCGFCYTHFGDLVDIVDIAQNGAKKHIGKVPKNFINAIDSSEKLKILKLRLAWAIEHEQFEDAAKLRDQLKELESLP
jgi:protein-arginine kinase activator protein McsA